MIDSVLIHILIGLIAGGVAGLIAGKIIKSADMGTFWNITMGAIGGFCMANLIFAYGFDDTNHWFGSLATALLGGAISQIFFGKIRHGLKVMWMVITGKQAEFTRDPYDVLK